MTTDSGWIKIHRKFKEKGYYKNSFYVHLWLHLLIEANHEGKEILWNGKTVNISRGTFITGRKIISQETGIKETTVERILNYLENEHQIGQQKTTKYRLITIVNYDKYQKLDSKTDNRRTTDGQQTDTTKNVRTKRIEEESQGDVPSQDVQTLISSFKSINPSYERMFANTTERGAATRLIKKYGLQKMIDTVNALPEIISQPYAPKIISPYSLEKDLGKLILFVEQNKKNIKTNKVAFT